MRDTCRGTQSYMEKRRGRREIEVARRRRGGIKRGESKLASDHFPMCFPQSGSLRDVHGVKHREEKRRKETEVARRVKGEIRRRETGPANNQFPKCSPQPGAHKDSQSWVVKKRGRGEIEVTWWRKTRVKRGREQSGH